MAAARLRPRHHGRVHVHTSGPQFFEQERGDLLDDGHAGLGVPA